MKLAEAHSAGFIHALEKFAVSGNLYARALQSTAARNGTRIAPQVLSGMQGQARAQTSPFLSSQARTPGALAPSPQLTHLQGVMDKVPWAGADNGGALGATKQYNQVLDQHGMTGHAAPNLNQHITENFGALPARGLGFEETQSLRGTTPAKELGFTAAQKLQETTQVGSKRRRGSLATADTVAQRPAL